MLIIILAVVIIIIATWMFYKVLMARAPFYDSVNNRFYKFSYDEKKGEWFKNCPYCKLKSRMIMTTTKPRKYGIYCDKHCEVWDDLYKKKL